jgi:hypothetical protein
MVLQNWLVQIKEVTNSTTRNAEIKHQGGGGPEIGTHSFASRNVQRNPADTCPKEIQ